MNQLKLGLARKIITPEVGCQLYGYSPNNFSDGVSDDLHATAFVFEQNDAKALLVTLDLCVINVDIADDIRTLIEKEVGIPAKHIMLSASHTHTGPNLSGGTGWGDIDTNYLKFFKGVLIDVVKEATSNMQPIKVGMARGDSLAGINRREITPNNTIKLGQNPWGSFNPQMTVIAFRNMEDNPVANIVHYGAHNTAGTGRCYKISRDWCGVMCDRLEEISGATTAFICGCAGDVGPRLSSGHTSGLAAYACDSDGNVFEKPSNGLLSGGLKYIWETGSVAALDAVRIYNSISHFSTEELKTEEFILKIPFKKRISYEEAKAGWEELKDFTGGNIGSKMKQVYADILKAYEDHIPEEEIYEESQTIISIGELAFIGFKYELFSEIGMRIAKYSDMPYALCACYTNGRGTYFPTEDQLVRGGYEVQHFQFNGIQSLCDNADWHLITETVNNLKSLKEEK